jgi:sulfoxide reductase heme-binding subunit YedZ
MWYLIRGFGMVAIIALSLTTVLGIASMRAAPGAAAADRRVLLQLIHRSLSLLGLVVLGLHIGLSAVDRYVATSLTGALIPFTAGYRPFAIGLGTIAMYAFIAAAVSGLGRAKFAGSRAGLLAWRSVHWMAYGGWVLAMGHSIFAGSDGNTAWARLTYVACGVAVGAAAGWRLLAPQTRRARDMRGRSRLISIGGGR